MTESFNPWEKELAEGKALVASGDFDLSKYQRPAGVEDDSLTTAIMLQPDDYGMDDVVKRAEIIQHFHDGLITLEEANAKLDDLTAEADDAASVEGDDEGDAEIQ